MELGRDFNKSHPNYWQRAHDRKRQSQRIRAFSKAKFSMRLSLPFSCSYFRAQTPLFGFYGAPCLLSGFLLLFPFIFFDFMV